MVNGQILSLLVHVCLIRSYTAEAMPKTGTDHNIALQ